MFKRDRNKQASICTLIDAKTRINGDLTFNGGLHLDGTIIGNVAAGSEGSAFLSVSEEACIEGTVDVPNIVLNGLVKGDIHASMHIKLGAGARVLGNVTYTNIETAVGAQINGKLIHKADSAPPIAEAEVEKLLTSPARFDRAARGE